MNPKGRYCHTGKPLFGFLVLFLPFFAAALACSFVPSSDQSLRSTDIALGIQQTLVAQTATALTMVGTPTSAPTSTPVSEPLPATETATPEPATPTTEPTPTLTPAPELIVLDEWEMSNMSLQAACDAMKEEPCLTGHGNDLKLVLETPILIEEAWERPYLTFSQEYRFEVDAYIYVNAGSRWDILWSYQKGVVRWHDVALDLSKYKGKEITLQFYVGGEVLKPGGVWWKPDKQTQSNNLWSLQNIQIVPNYLP